MNSRINKMAWKIRRNAAKKHSCNVMEINWGHCYHKAVTIIKKRQERAIRRTAKRYEKGSLKGYLTMNNTVCLIFVIVCNMACCCMGFLINECIKYNSGFVFAPVLGILFVGCLGFDIACDIENELIN